MGYRCYLCKGVSDKVKKISLHSFPDRQKYPHIYNQWLAVCDLNEQDDLSGIRICTSHFQEQEKLLDYTYAQIKQGAIPSINVKNKKAVVRQQIEKHNEEVPPHPQTDTTSELVSMVKKLSPVSEKVIVGNLCSMDDLDKHFEALYSCIKENRSCTTMTFALKSDLDPSENTIPVATHDVSATPTVNINSNLVDTPLAEKSYRGFETSGKKRRYFDPRYISELEISDMATPRSASRIVKFVKETDRKKTLKIRHLQESKRYLQKRVSLLERRISMLEHCMSDIL